MRRKRMRLVSLILSAVCLLGCAVQPAPVSDSSESNTKVSAYAASQAEQNEEERTEAESCCRKQKMEAIHLRAASLLSGKCIRECG